MKFHVGDKWADEQGLVWAIFAVVKTTAKTTTWAGNTYGYVSAFDIDGASLTGKRLTRLISSERWIPFAEMMPEAPVLDKESRSLVIYRKAYDIQVLDAYGTSWEDTGGRTLQTWVNTYKYTHWKYLTPPEAS